MRPILVMLFSLLLPATLLADDFVSVFMNRCAEEERPLHNVNIGRAMLDKMAANTEDEELKTAFKELNSIRIVSSDSREDSKHYFVKAEELIEESFGDYEEAVSLRETASRIAVWIKRGGEEKQDLILLSLDNNGKLSIITVSGKIDFSAISKLSRSLRDTPQLP